MLLGEGPVIIRESIQSALEDLGKLRAVAQEGLRTPAYEAVVARVLTQKELLHGEIFSPAQGSNCGIGSYARTIVARIGEDLRGFSVIRGTDELHDCRDGAGLQRIYDTYAGGIDEGCPGR